jgi:alpha-glucosidase
MAWRTEAGEDVLAFDRGEGFACVVNTGSTPVPLPAGATVLLASGDLTADGGLPGDTAVWLKP